jgi:hypothetical protein
MHYLADFDPIPHTTILDSRGEFAPSNLLSFFHLALKEAPKIGL